MNNKTCLITGGNSGIGFQAAKDIALKGFEVCILCRNEKKGKAAVRQIQNSSGNPKVSLIVGDLASLKSIQQAAAEIREKFPVLDVLVNNAGGYFPDYRETEEGFEYTFGVNHLGHFYLTYLLRENLLKSDDGRILNVSSEASKAGTMDFDDLMFKNGYSGIRAYGRAKLANIFFTYLLDEKYAGTNLKSFAIHPGPVNTNFGSEAKGFGKFLMWMFRPFMLTPKKGADTVVWLATSDGPEIESGKYYMKRKQIRSKEETYDKSVQQRFWKVSEELTGINWND